MRQMMASNGHREAPVTREMIAYLRHVFPDRKVTLASTEREIFLNVGVQSVIEHLQTALTRQENDTSRRATHGPTF